MNVDVQRAALPIPLSHRVYLLVSNFHANNTRDKHRDDSIANNVNNRRIYACAADVVGYNT